MDNGEQGQPVNVAAKPALALSKRQMLRADRTPIQKKVKEFHQERATLAAHTINLF